jgi:hypothetical protein
MHRTGFGFFFVFPAVSSAVRSNPSLSCSVANLLFAVSRLRTAVFFTTPQSTPKPGKNKKGAAQRATPFSLTSTLKSRISSRAG